MLFDGEPNEVFGDLYQYILGDVLLGYVTAGLANSNIGWMTLDGCQKLEPRSLKSQTREIASLQIVW